MSATTTTSNEPVQVGGEYWSAQLQVFDALESGDYDVVVFRAGYGGGKTLLGSDYVIGEALQIPNGHSLILAPDKTKGGPATYKGFYERLPGENTVPNDADGGPADGDPENSPIVAGHHGTKHRVTLVNGHIIQLGGADIWSRFAGTEFNVIWCDEVAHYGTTDLFDLHEMLVTRQRTEQGPNVTLWTSTGNGFNQFYDITEQQVQPDGQGGEEKLPWADRLKVIVGDTRDNPFHHELDKMRAQFEGTERERQALEGGFSAAEGLVYSSFSRETHIRERGEVDVVDDWRLYGYDYGHADPRVLLEIGKTPADQYVVLDEYYETQQPVEKLTGNWDNGRLVRDGWVQKQGKQPGEVYCDHEPEHLEKFTKAGFEAYAATKNLDEGIEEVRSVLEVDEANGIPGLLVVEDCVNLIKEFQSYKEEDVGTSRADDHCFVAGTMVATDAGHVPIEEIEPGDQVLTRVGFRRVLASGMTAEDADVLTLRTTDGRELTGTAGHPVFTPHDGFKQLDSLRYGEMLSGLPAWYWAWQSPKQSSSRASPSGGIRTPASGPTATTTDRAATTSRTASKHSTAKCGNITTARSLTATSSTTSTRTPQTTVPRTSSASAPRSTPDGTQIWATRRTSTSRKSSNSRKSGTRQKKEKSGTGNTGTTRSQRPSTKRERSATSAATSSPTTAPRTPDGSARTPARQSGGESREETTRRESARPADTRSQPTSTATRPPVRVAALEPCSRGRNVYNLTVEGQHEYYANGLLVHNCLDSLRYGIMGDRYVEDDSNSGSGTW